MPPKSKTSKSKVSKKKALKSKFKKSVKKKTYGIVDPSVGNYEKHPFFIKKANEARALIERVGLPKEVTGKK